MFNLPLSRRSFLTISAMTAAAFALDWTKISAYAAKMGSKTDSPAVIIGAGLGGLVCGAYLAKLGVPVTVVEQHSIPGGYATSFERAGGKYNFEVSLHGTSINDNGASRILNDIGILDKLELVQLPEVYRLKTPDLDISVPQKDPEAYIKVLSKHFPEEAEGIRGFVKEMIAIADEVDTLSRNKGQFIKLLGGFFCRLLRFFHLLIFFRQFFGQLLDSFCIFFSFFDLGFFRLYFFFCGLFFKNIRDFHFFRQINNPFLSFFHHPGQPG